ncbi:uncharacterized protein BDV14DRAFT_179822 [Aspergillus stella-maris]|uniref:uncharacterized protein n=1 Tax=Aspergillus stella-maris TaxID=1810926 RepID=UPI003CCC9483
MVLQFKSRSARRKRQVSGQHTLYALLVPSLWTEVTCLAPLRQLIPPMVWSQHATSSTSRGSVTTNIQTNSRVAGQVRCNVNAQARSAVQCDGCRWASESVRVMRAPIRGWERLLNQHSGGLRGKLPILC